MTPIDSDDFETRKRNFERLRFIMFVESKKPLKPCKCGDPHLVLAEGPPNEPGSVRRIECGACHQFYFWLPKSRNRDKRPASSIGLASGNFCQCCLKAGANLVGHHVVPVADGGSNAPENIWTLCAPCHDVVHALRRHALEPQSAVGEAQRREDAA